MQLWSRDTGLVEQFEAEAITFEFSKLSRSASIGSFSISFKDFNIFTSAILKTYSLSPTLVSLRLTSASLYSKASSRLLTFLTRDFRFCSISSSNSFFCSSRSFCCNCNHNSFSSILFTEESTFFSFRSWNTPQKNSRSFIPTENRSSKRLVRKKQPET